MSLPSFREDGYLPVGHHPATWEEVAERFGGNHNSHRQELLDKLHRFRDGLRAHGVTGRMLLNGSFVSAKEFPKDFDILLIAQPAIQSMKDADPALSRLLDAEMAENHDGYSVFYSAENSPVIGLLLPLFDETKSGVPKGVTEVIL